MGTASASTMRDVEGVQNSTPSVPKKSVKNFQIFGLRAMLTQFRRLIARWKALKKTLLPIYGFPIIKLSDHTLIFD